MGLNESTDWGDETDEALALAHKSGDVAAYEELVRRHQSRVYSVAYRITLNREDALDVAQESLFKAYTKIGQWEPTVGFVPWLMRLTTNQAIDVLRRNKRRATQPLDDVRLKNLEDRAVATTDTAEQVVRGGEIEQKIREAMADLSVTQRAVFAMRHYEGLALSDIAGALGCSTGSVKVHLFRALKKLQKNLGAFYRSQQ